MFYIFGMFDVIKKDRTIEATLAIPLGCLASQISFRMLWTLSGTVFTSKRTVKLSCLYAIDIVSDDLIGIFLTFIFFLKRLFFPFWLWPFLRSTLYINHIYSVFFSIFQNWKIRIIHFIIDMLTSAVSLPQPLIFCLFKKKTKLWLK